MALAVAAMTASGQASPPSVVAQATSPASKRRSPATQSAAAKPAAVGAVAGLIGSHRDTRPVARTDTTAAGTATARITPNSVGSTSSPAGGEIPAVAELASAVVSHANPTSGPVASSPSPARRPVSAASSGPNPAAIS